MAATAAVGSRRSTASRIRQCAASERCGRPDGVTEAAVTGEPDADLGERVVAWVVPAQDADADAGELAEHVARLLSPHKRPREVHFLEELPRNAMGKARKADLAVRR